MPLERHQLRAGREFEVVESVPTVNCMAALNLDRSTIDNCIRERRVSFRALRVREGINLVLGSRRLAELTESKSDAALPLTSLLAHLLDSVALLYNAAFASIVVNTVHLAAERTYLLYSAIIFGRGTRRDSRESLIKSA